MTDQDPCRVMAEQIWKWAAVPTPYAIDAGDEVKERWINEIAETLRKHTALPDLVESLSNCLKWIEPVMDGFGVRPNAESRELLVAAKAALAKAKGRQE